MEWDWPPGQRCFQSFRMRSFIFFSIEMGQVNKTLQYFCSHLNDLVKGFRSKTFPASLTGVPSVRFNKALKCYFNSIFTGCAAPTYGVTYGVNRSNTVVP